TIICLTLISIIALLYFVIWNYFQKYPLIDFSFFKNRNFTLGTICITVGFLIYFGSTVTLPLWLQTEHGYTAYWAWLATAPIGIIPFFLSAWLGKNMYRIDLRILGGMSFLFFALAFFYQSLFTTQVGLPRIMLTRLLQGVGVSIFFLPLVQLSL